MEKRESLIRVAYCFDNNIARHVCVSVSALLKSNTQKDVHYEVFCVCTKDAQWIKSLLEEIVRKEDADSHLIFIVVEDIYQAAYERSGVTKVTYVKLMLPSLLLHVDKIIYMDVDLIVNDCLQDVWQVDLSNSYLAGVKDKLNILNEWQWAMFRYNHWSLYENWRGKYINAGFLLMNLDRLRRTGVATKWVEMIKTEFFFQDQDIINITCRDLVEKEEDAVIWLPTKYNLMAHMNGMMFRKFVCEEIYTEQEVREALDRPVCVHYAGEKPWNNLQVNRANLWWKFVWENELLRELFIMEWGNCLNSLSAGYTYTLEDTSESRNITDIEKLTTESQKNLANFLLLNNWIMLMQNQKSLGAYVRDKGYKKVAIYGMHYIGERLYVELTENDVEVCYGIDRGRVTLNFDLTIYKPAEALPMVDMIIVTPIYWFEEIKKNLEDKVSCPIISLKELIEEI